MTIEGAEDDLPSPPSLGGWLMNLVDAATASHRRAIALLVALAVLCFAPGFFSLPPVDRDEARFAQATKQMLEGGDYVDIRFQTEARHKKPVGIYWLQAGVVSVAEAVGIPEARTQIWLYRIPSLIGAIGGVLLTYWTALAFVSRRWAVVAAAMLASCVLLGVEARLAKTDAMLFLTIMAAQGALAHAFCRRVAWSGRERWLIPATFWTALAAGVLLKGPIILMVVGLTVLGTGLITKSWRWLGALRPAFGLPWALLLILPWFVAITLKTQGAFFGEAVGHDMLGKIAAGQEKHWGPPGFYLVAFWVTFWPAAPMVLFAAPATWRDRFDPKVMFLLAWVVPAWLIFEMVPTKLPHYVLPLFPALAILAVRALERGAVEPAARWWTRGAEWWWAAIGLLLPALALIGLLLFHRGAGFLAWPFMFAAGFLGFKAVETLRVEGPERGFMVSILAAVAVYVAVLQVLIPATRTYFPAAALVAAANGAGCPDPKIASASYREPSLVFLGGTDVELTDASGAARFLREGDCRVAFVDRRHERAFALEAEALGLRYRLLTVVKAANYNGGRRLNLAVFVNTP
ncbi:ArnT family glycosyltransferase [Blastochloris viridis]|uniref:4-amino-4-deoxy-L-arabinose transferase and related glycosyltransferases of PMT family n=1 Tax=Blastochloris viridis TaxID=1079 RepID=A0A182D594_BLAVI|nr:glycosyltransferase family 39 protein [Blastochloris viridis]ALK09486.1 Undecaprenyl phosphate-alpha-4-amino-4-deoxy-L-arabinose arabinosyl transferase [Blastochloris viridis]BAS00630.1 4-amino-4-deoxy-L-arabinose transferase and related glycosyltransferases of PMT family [Blastochloris viridis]